MTDYVLPGNILNTITTKKDKPTSVFFLNLFRAHNGKTDFQRKKWHISLSLPRVREIIMIKESIEGLVMVLNVHFLVI